MLVFSNVGGARGAAPPPGPGGVSLPSDPRLPIPITEFQTRNWRYVRSRIAISRSKRLAHYSNRFVNVACTL